MAGKDNLKVPTSAEARKNGKKGGIASGKARRERKAMKDTLASLLSMPMNSGKTADVDKIKYFAALQDQNITVQEAIMLAQIQLAIAGDTKAAEYVRDTSGNKLKDGVVLSGNINNPFADLTTEELKKLIASE